MLSTPKSCLPTSTATTLQFTLENHCWWGAGWGGTNTHLGKPEPSKAAALRGLCGRARGPPSHSPELRFVRTWGTSISSLLLPTARAPIPPWLLQHQTRKSIRTREDTPSQNRGGGKGSPSIGCPRKGWGLWLCSFCNLNLHVILQCHPSVTKEMRGCGMCPVLALAGFGRHPKI